jgi:hypothetical protein
MPVSSAEHPVFSPPSSDALLWRYVDLSKYLSVLSSRTLWFSRADLLGDRFEGSMSRANLRLRPTVYADVPGGLPAIAVAQLEQARRMAPRHHYISCWHCSQWESAAMWRLYMRDHGIAIISTYDRMKRALEGDDEIFLGLVRYSDYDKDWIAEGNGFEPFMHKRHSFQHEQEVRAVIARFPMRPKPDAEGEQVIDYSLPSPPGLAIPVRVNDLISEVRVAPDAPDWVFEVVSDVTQRYEYQFPVVQSELGGEPVY